MKEENNGYKALYRKYRPLTFDDVVSQPHITTTLENQIINSKTAHAYLFTGSRGTGKTTCARIFAKAVNCEHPVNGNPCLECSVCRDADENALSDIIEIDAASNNGVDDVRELREGAIYTPERCKYKIYIIDEVHMLSKEAFNALLKIMEEPPPHVKFILATTEIHKVLPTILSRCQRYDFRRITTLDITERLLYVANTEGISLERDAAELIAKTADGGMRDALSLLDQCIAFSDHVTLEVVSDAAGIAGRDYLFDIIDAVTQKNPAKAITVIDKLYDMSKDMQKLCDELIAQFRNIMMAKAVPQNADVIVCMPNELEMIKNTADMLSLDDIMYKLEILQAANERLAKASAKRVEIEMCIIKLCSERTAATAAASNNDELLNKIASLEQKLMNASFVPQEKAKTAAPVKSANADIVTDLSKMKLEDFKPVQKWTEILEAFSEMCPAVTGALDGSRAVENQGYMLIYAENAFFIQLLRIKENAEKLSVAVKKVTGNTYSIRSKYVGNTTENVQTAANSDKMKSLIEKAVQNDITTECK